MNKKTVRDVELTGKRVLVRVDFNVPLSEGKVSDDTRIRAAIPTLRYILDQKPRAVILMSHLGRPKDAPDPAYSLKPVVPVLSDLLGVPVAFAEDCLGEKPQAALAALPNGGVLIVENTRFYKGESKNDPAMAEQLAKLGDVYVNDAFGSAHRAHASTEGVTRFLPAVAGFLLEKEIEYLSSTIANPERPFVAIMGGAKISDKIGVIKNLLTRADAILIGGGMANTFMKAQGLAVADSLVEDDSLEIARALFEEAGGKIHLPVDMVVANQFAADAESKTLKVQDVPDGWRILDIGPETVKAFRAIIATARTVVWNGPMGVFEFPKFAEGTFGVAKAVADSAAVSVIGGGESVAAIQQSGLADKITHISTGGGASLEMLEGLELPGVAALLDK